MEDWAIALGQEVLEGEREVVETWKRIVDGIKQTVSELDSVLRDKSTLKLTVDHATPDHVTVKSDRGNSVTLGINRVARTIPISGTAGSGHFYITHVGDKLQFNSSNQNSLFGLLNTSQVTVDDAVKRIITYVIDIR